LWCFSIFLAFGRDYEIEGPDATICNISLFCPLIQVKGILDEKQVIEWFWRLKQKGGPWGRLSDDFRSMA